MLPKSEVDIHIVVGKGLQLPVIAKPTREEVELWHGIYVKYLIDVYDTNKNRFGEPRGSSRPDADQSKELKEHGDNSKDSCVACHGVHFCSKERKVLH